MGGAATPYLMYAFVACMWGNFTFFYLNIICDINDVGIVRGSDSRVAHAF
jgi:hypothetical protein